MELLVIVPGFVLIIMLAQYVNYTLALFLGMMVIVPATGLLYILGKAIARRYPKYNPYKGMHPYGRSPRYARQRNNNVYHTPITRPVSRLQPGTAEFGCFDDPNPAPFCTPALIPRSRWDYSLPGDTTMQTHLDTIPSDKDRAYILSLPRHDRKGLVKQYLESK